jgi:hypothetical protein
MESSESMDPRETTEATADVDALEDLEVGKDAAGVIVGGHQGNPPNPGPPGGGGAPQV